MVNDTNRTICLNMIYDYECVNSLELLETLIKRGWESLWIFTLKSQKAVQCSRNRNENGARWAAAQCMNVPERVKRKTGVRQYVLKKNNHFFILKAVSKKNVFGGDLNEVTAFDLLVYVVHSTVLASTLRMPSPHDFCVCGALKGGTVLRQYSYSIDTR